MSFVLVACDAVASQPWRNGAGTTRELLTWPDAQHWRYRISVADVRSDGEFSSYPGVTRCFAVVDGAGVELCIDDARHRQLPGAPALRFRGDSRVDCRLLDGPTRDLNLMLRDVDGDLQPARDAASWTPPAGACGLFATQAGRCRFTADSQASEEFVDVPRLALLWFERAPKRVLFQSSGGGSPDVGYWMAVHAR